MAKSHTEVSAVGMTAVASARIVAMVTVSVVQITSLNFVELSLWVREQDSNLWLRNTKPVCYRLHYPAICITVQICS